MLNHSETGADSTPKSFNALEKLYGSDLDLSLKAVAAYLWFRADRDSGEAWPSQARMTRDLSRSERQIRNLLKQLELAGAITIVRGVGREVNRYRIHFNRLVDRKPISGQSESPTGNRLPVNSETDCRCDRQRLAGHPGNGLPIEQQRNFQTKKQEPLSHTRESFSTPGEDNKLPPPDGPPEAFNHEAELRFVQEWNGLADELPAHLVRHGGGSLTKFTRERLADRWAATWATDWPAFVVHLRTGRCDKTAMTIKQVVEGDLLDRIVAEAKHPQPKRKKSARRSSGRSSGSDGTSEARWRDFDAIDLERRLTKCRTRIQNIESQPTPSTDDIQRMTDLQTEAGEIEAEINRRKDKKRERLNRSPLFDHDIAPDALADLHRRNRLFNELVDAGHLQGDAADRLRLHTLAVHVTESKSAENPPALFLSLLKDALAGDGWPGTDAQEDHAREQLRNLTARKPPNGQVAALADKLKAAAPVGACDDD